MGQCMSKKSKLTTMFGSCSNEICISTCFECEKKKKDKVDETTSTDDIMESKIKSQKINKK